MGISDLPLSYEHWLLMRQEHLQLDLIRSEFTIDLYKQYRKHLGAVRYELLKQAQMLVVPQTAKNMLSLGRISWLTPVIGGYKLTRLLKLNGLLRDIILPAEYKSQINDLDLV